jgi:hypothetical protein
MAFERTDQDAARNQYINSRGYTPRSSAPSPEAPLVAGRTYLRLPLRIKRQPFSLVGKFIVPVRLRTEEDLGVA